MEKVASKEEMLAEEMGTKKEETHFPLVNKIKETIDMLKEVDEYFDKLPELQQEIDYDLSDLLHFLQKISKDDKKLSSKQCVNLIKVIQEKRLIREALIYDNEIKNAYNNHRPKLQHNVQRDMFMTEIYKKEKELNNDYKWRRLTEETILDLIK